MSADPDGHFSVAFGCRTNGDRRHHPGVTTSATAAADHTGPTRGLTGTGALAAIGAIVVYVGVEDLPGAM